MITPGATTFTGYIGSTFDTIVTVYPSVDAAFNWTGNWNATAQYSIGDVAIAFDNQAYDTRKANINVYPVGDLTGSWSTPITPQNLNGYSGSVTLVPISANEYSQAPILTTPVIIQGTQGTIAWKFTVGQTGAMVPGSVHYFVTILDPSGNTYYYLNGPFVWDSP